MHTKTMEGLAGASTNMKLLNTPFHVYKDAERRYWYYTENPNLLYSNNGSILPPVGIIVFLA